MHPVPLLIISYRFGPLPTAALPLHLFSTWVRRKAFPLMKSATDSWSSSQRRCHIILPTSNCKERPEPHFQIPIRDDSLPLIPTLRDDVFALKELGKLPTSARDSVRRPSVCPPHLTAPYHVTDSPPLKPRNVGDGAALHALLQGSALRASHPLQRPRPQRRLHHPRKRPAQRARR